jgi:thiol:disulfide interchange protein
MFSLHVQFTEGSNSPVQQLRVQLAHPCPLLLPSQQQHQQRQMSQSSLVPCLVGLGLSVLLTEHQTCGNKVNVKGVVSTSSEYNYAQQELQTAHHTVRLNRSTDWQVECKILKIVSFSEHL